MILDGSFFHFLLTGELICSFLRIFAFLLGSFLFCQARQAHDIISRCCFKTEWSSLKVFKLLFSPWQTMEESSNTVTDDSFSDRQGRVEDASISFGVVRKKTRSTTNLIPPTPSEFNYASSEESEGEEKFEYIQENQYKYVNWQLVNQWRWKIHDFVENPTTLPVFSFVSI